MNTTEPGWYVVKIEEGRAVWIREGPYDKEKAEKAAAESGQWAKALYWDGKIWQEEH